MDSMVHSKILWFDLRLCMVKKDLLKMLHSSKEPIIMWLEWTSQPAWKMDVKTLIVFSSKYGTYHCILATSSYIYFVRDFYLYMIVLYQLFYFVYICVCLTNTWTFFSIWDEVSLLYIWTCLHLDSYSLNVFSPVFKYLLYSVMFLIF